MAEYDLVVRGGTVVTGSDSMRADVGIRDGRIAAIGERLEGASSLDAGGLLVLPGGVDTHCHIEQLQQGGGADEETWESASRACFAGGTTSVISFSTQFKVDGVAITCTVCETLWMQPGSLGPKAFGAPPSTVYLIT